MVVYECGGCRTFVDVRCNLRVVGWVDGCVVSTLRQRWRSEKDDDASRCRHTTQQPVADETRGGDERRRRSAARTGERTEGGGAIDAAKLD